MSKQLICSQCGHVGNSSTGVKGSFLIEIVLWLCFIIPGLIYSLWRSTSRYKKCPVCGSTNMIPIDSPVGQKLLADQGKTLEQVLTEKPKKVRTRGEKIMIGVVAAIGFFFVIGLIGAINSSPSAPVTQPVAVRQAVDVPSLVGLSLTEIREKLGTPSYDTEPNDRQIALGVDTWEKSWDVGEYSIMATYDYKTKKVTDIFFGGNSDAAFERFKDTNNILAAGGLSTGDPKYSVEFVKAKNAPGYTGAIIRAK